MDFLLGDVRKNRFPGRLADRKNTVAALPAESVMALAFYDSGRAGFEILDQLGEGDLSGECAKNMDMIFHTADLKRVALQATQSSGQIGMQLRSEFGGLQEWHSIFGGENDVHQTRASDWDICNYIIFICYYRARSCAPFGRVSVRGRFPGLKPRADSCSPFGAKTVPPPSLS